MQTNLITTYQLTAYFKDGRKNIFTGTSLAACDDWAKKNIDEEQLKICWLIEATAHTANIVEYDLPQSNN